MTDKAKRKLSNFDFSKKGCHISLVGPANGGPANGVTTLLLKSLSPSGATKVPNGEGNKMEKEFVEKSAVDAMITKAVGDAVEAATKVFKSQIADMEAAQKAVVEKSRKEKIAKAVGDAKADETFNAIKSLDDNAFEIVLKGLVSAKDAEAKGDMFTEKGVDAKGDKDKQEDLGKSLREAMVAKYAKQA